MSLFVERQGHRHNRAINNSKSITVTVTTIQLLSFSVLPSGAVEFTVTGNVAGKTNLAQASADFTNWVTLDTITSSGATVIDTNAPSFPIRFYRAIELP